MTAFMAYIVAYDWEY